LFSPDGILPPSQDEMRAVCHGYAFAKARYLYILTNFKRGSDP